LDLANQSVRKISFEMTADLSEIFSILDSDQQQQTWLLDVFRAEAPAASDRERIIENVLTVGAVDRDDRELYLLLLVELCQRRL
jgi:hypothetical protein